MSTQNNPTAGSRTIRVELGERSYDILIESGVLERAGSLIAPRVKGRKCLIVSDRNVGPVFGHRLAKSVQMAGFDGTALELPPGESTKSFQVAGNLLDVCIDIGLDRNSCLIALGGGVIGDLTGFVAATYFRGIPVIQIPTTLLAMVDAAIGGKTGVDHPKAKNAIGAFHQPRVVLADPLTLASLPDRELRAGLAEVIKYGVIDDAELFAYLEQNMHSLLKKSPVELAHIIERSASIKARIVSQDEKESAGGPRALLNFGHTFGHALESATGYTEYLHGEAVAIGMSRAADLSVELQLMTRADRDRIVALIDKAGLPTRIQPGDPDTQTLHQASFKDKKAASGKLNFIVSEKIGSAKVVSDVSDEMAKKVWDAGRG